MVTSNRRRWLGLGLPATVLVAVLAIAGALGAGLVHGQEEETAPHPAHIHAGTCDDLGDVVAPLSDVGSRAAPDGTPVSASAPIGPASAIPVAVSRTTVDLALADIIEDGHAINIHQSAEQIGTYIACGDVGGAVMDETLAIGLAELNDSGASGIAVLEGDGSQTTVTIYLTGATAATGGAADDETATASEADVEIVDFTYNPDPVEIAVGGTITWTNQDAEPHTATARDRDLLQTGTLRGGESASATFSEPGTYEYFCEFHANMGGTIIVE